MFFFRLVRSPVDRRLLPAIFSIRKTMMFKKFCRRFPAKKFPVPKIFRRPKKMKTKKKTNLFIQIQINSLKIQLLKTKKKNQKLPEAICDPESLLSIFGGLNVYWPRKFLRKKITRMKIQSWTKKLPWKREKKWMRNRWMSKIQSRNGTVYPSGCKNR